MTKAEKKDRIVAYTEAGIVYVAWLAICYIIGYFIGTKISKKFKEKGIN